MTRESGAGVRGREIKISKILDNEQTFLEQIECKINLVEKCCTTMQCTVDSVSDLHPGAIKHKYIRYVAIFHWFLTQKLHLKGKKHCLSLEGTQVKLQGV